MKIVHLNIRHGGGSRASQLVELLGKFAADVLVLTEYRENMNATFFKASLFASGYKWQASSSLEGKQNAVLVAARLPFVSKANLGESEVDAHRLLHAQFARFNLVGVYFPQLEAKRPVFDYLVKNSKRLLGDTGLLIGDFNTGKHLLDEAGETFACTDCLDNLESAGLVDAWRSRNPDAREFSWYSTANNGFRIDHVYCTQRLNQRVTRISYDHAPRLSAATDHAAMVVEIDL